MIPLFSFLPDIILAFTFTAVAYRRSTAAVPKGTNQIRHIDCVSSILAKELKVYSMNSVFTYLSRLLGKVINFGFLNRNLNFLRAISVNCTMQGKKPNLHNPNPHI
jgi:hypothetical protein